MNNVHHKKEQNLLQSGKYNHNSTASMLHMQQSLIAKPLRMAQCIPNPVQPNASLEEYCSNSYLIIQAYQYCQCVPQKGIQRNLSSTKEGECKNFMVAASATGWSPVQSFLFGIYRLQVVFFWIDMKINFKFPWSCKIFLHCLQLQIAKWHQTLLGAYGPMK